MDEDNHAKNVVGQMISACAADNIMNNANLNNISGLDRVRPQVPPNSLDLLPKEIADYRDSKQFDGFSVYRHTCVQRAQNQGLNLTFRTISFMANRLWNSEPENIKQVYRDIAEEVAQTYNFHRNQFSEHVRVYVIIQKKKNISNIKNTIITNYNF
jgi:hypothetical protein